MTLDHRLASSLSVRSSSPPLQSRMPSSTNAVEILRPSAHSNCAPCGMKPRTALSTLSITTFCEKYLL